MKCSRIMLVHQRLCVLDPYHGKHWSNWEDLAKPVNHMNRWSVPQEAPQNGWFVKIILN